MCFSMAESQATNQASKFLDLKLIRDFFFGSDWHFVFGFVYKRFFMSQLNYY